MFSAKKILCATTALVLAAPLAHAAGFQLKEQSATMQGVSFAGASAKATDASVMYYNPAGIARLKGTQTYGAVSLIKPQAKFDQDTTQFSAAAALSATAHTVNDGEGGDAGGLAAVPALYAMTTLDNGVKVGFSINTPFGLKTEYDSNWVGRYHAIKSELLTMSFAPTVAWKANDKWSFGGAVNIQYADANLTNAFRTNNAGQPEGLQDLAGDDVSLGFRLGAMYEPTEHTRFGLAYHSGVHHKLEGEVVATVAGTVVQTVNASAKLRTPDIASLGMYHEINDQWSVLGEVAWTNWSTFKDLTVINRDTGAVASTVDESWDDSYFAAVGVEYHPCNCDNQTWQFGIAYDKTPVDDEHRTFRIPDSDRYWVSAGYQHEIDANKSFNIGYTHIFADDAKVTENASTASKGTVAGEFEASVDILAAGFKWKF